MNNRILQLYLTVSLGAVLLSGCGVTKLGNADPLSKAAAVAVAFTDVSTVSGISDETSWKYGGPSVSDLNNDGRYDFLLTNHDVTPIRVYLANDDLSYRLIPDVFKRVDLHGIAAGDYDLDGDNDVLISLGGGNGASPRPQRLLRNDNGVFVDVTEEAGLSEMGARGRSVRWVDLDSDGDLDFLQINAAQMTQETGPRNILFENLGAGTFNYKPSPAFEQIAAERVLITDFNGDDVMDVIAFDAHEELSIWLGHDDFSFTDVTNKLLTEKRETYADMLAAAHADIDNDGDLDYYFARGKVHYPLANNSVSFSAELGRLDLRDEGNKSHDGITLHADGDIVLTDFYHFPRAKLLDAMPVFLGRAKTEIDTPINATNITAEQAQGFPQELNETGWYLGYVGNSKWRLEWVLNDNLAWDVRASIKGLSGYTPDWVPQDTNVPDVLLINDGDRFVDASHTLPIESNFNNWGVSTGDFNNDGRNDFFLSRFGELKRRIEDVLLINQGKQRFSSVLDHGANTELGNDSHGDMGVAFDYNLDGKLDLLNGDDDNGGWHLYRNDTTLNSDRHYLLARVGYSENGVDPMGAKIKITTNSGRQFKLIGSNNAAHSQSLLNIVHFGLGENEMIQHLDVRWRDGSQLEMNNVKADQLLVLGEFKQ